jgi:hypothetical protein
MPYGNLNVDTVTTSTAGGVLGAGNASLLKNRLINGSMVIDQRNAGASVTGVSGAVYTVDRWQVQCSQASKLTVQQNAGSVTPPTGFVNYLGVISSSAYTVGASESFYLNQRIEGLNIGDLGWGTADAKTVTLSFWVRSSLTGSFGASLWNSAANRVYPVSYTISAANTWEQKSITIAGDTSGTWLTSNGIGINVNFGLGFGSSISGTSGAWNAGTGFMPTGATSVVGTSGATFYITGVQLEVGSSATGYEYRQYGTELSLCQRYYAFVIGPAQTMYIDGYQTSGNNICIVTVNPTTMRATPTGAVVGNWNTTNTSAGNPTIYTGFEATTLTWSASATGRLYAYNQLNAGYSLSAEL